MIEPPCEKKAAHTARPFFSQFSGTLDRVSKVRGIDRPICLLRVFHAIMNDRLDNLSYIKRSNDL